MDKFLKKASEKLSLLDPSQTQKLFADMLEATDLKDSILDSFSDGIILINEKQIIYYQNKSVSSLISVNYSKKYRFRTLQSQIVDTDITDFLSSFWTCKDKKSTCSKEFTYQNGENVRIIQIQVFRNFTVFHGHKCDMIRISDITAHRIEENRLKRSESLAQMTTMAAGVAHEIKNPLGSISLYLQLLRREYKKHDSLTGAQAEKYLSVISEEIDRLNSIVVDFLFAVRPLTVNLAKEDINSLVSDIAAFVHPELDQYKMKLELKLEPGLPKLEIDSSLFRQAALNMIKNSIQAIQARYPSDLSKGILQIETKLSNDNVDVVFSDNGCGIPENLISKVFEPYYTTKDTGTGLGLTVLFKIVKEHHGDLNVISKVNEGTAFIISFPVPRDERMRLPSKTSGEEEKVVYEENDSDSR
ncbi:MAG: ATP-binding protein [Sphaerochaetaceae bacterium]